jgi:hypothetical protein
VIEVPTRHELRGCERKSDGKPVRLAPSQTCKHPRHIRGRFIDEAKVRGFPSGPWAELHALSEAGCMAATGSFHSVNSLALGSGPCMALLRIILAR